MKTQIITTEQPVMMSSKDIAELTDKNKSDIHVDIWNMLKQLYGIEKDAGNFHHQENQQVIVTDGAIACFDNRGYVSEFLLDRRHTEILITGYDVVRRAAVIDRWFKLESGTERPVIESMAALNPDFVALARTITEATASAMMKTILENTGIQATVCVNATVSAPPATGPVIIHQQDDEKHVDDSEYVPIHKVSWDSGLTDSTCRRLVDFAALPNGYVNGVRGLCVHYAIFMTAVRALIDESTPPTGKRKRWQHPEFGGFSLRKDPLEIFGESNA